MASFSTIALDANKPTTDLTVGDFVYCQDTGKAYEADSATTYKTASKLMAGLEFPGGILKYLREDGSWSTPLSVGIYPWIYIKIASDFTTSSATAVDVTGLAFTPIANLDYEYEAVLNTRTASAIVGPRPGLAWATGLTDGTAVIRQPSAVTTELITYGNISAALLTPVGGVPTTTGSWLATIQGSAKAGASPTGTIKIQLASETAGTIVTIKAGSFLKYRTY